MVHSCLLGSAFFQSQRSLLPQTFCRYKSLTAAIERGKQSYDSRFEGPNRRSRPDDSFPSQPRGNWGGRSTDQPQVWNRDRHDLSDRRQVFRQNGENSDTFTDILTRYKSFVKQRDHRNAFEGGNESGRGFENRSGRRWRSRNKNGMRDQDLGTFIQRFKGRPSPGQESGENFETDRGNSDFRGQGEDRGRFQDRGEKRPFQEGRDGRTFNRNSGRRLLGSREAQGTRITVPESLPYTTAASDFIYGYASVFAAVKANRRKFYKLYMHTRGKNHLGKDALVTRAKKLGIKIHEVGDEYLRVLDKASNGRPHNGFILEASPLPVPPITELRTCSVTGSSFEVTLDKQTKEDAAINGTQENYAYKSGGWRYPLVLYVDGVLDEGNLGAIARSAYLLGVDAIVTPSRQIAPWSHIALKASAGAAEAIPIFSVKQPADFLAKSAREGWCLYASDAIPEQPTQADTAPEDAVAETMSRGIVYTVARSSQRLADDHCPVGEHATILMMGAEGTGLRAGLLNAAHYKVGIRHGREVDEVGVDSFNVSVAASLLCYEMLQKPKHAGRKPEKLLF